MKKLTLSILCFIAFEVHAQTSKDTAQILRAANDYIEGFYFGDTSKIYFSIDTAASKHGYAKRNTDSTYRKVPMSFKQMVGYSKNERNRPTEANAKIRDIHLMDVNEKIAAVKLRLWWGIDYILLTKMQDRWVIEKVLWQSL